jgi:hypothetical protein
LAYAGFDARSAVQFWEEREATETCAEITSNVDRPSPITPPSINPDGTKPQPSVLGQLSEYPPFSWVGQGGGMAGTWFTKKSGHEKGGHPISAERVRRLRAELDRWDKERATYIKQAEEGSKQRLSTA